MHSLSPARFSHSVHNTQVGLFSIWARNPLPSVSVAAGAETFAHGFLEAVGRLQREPEPAGAVRVGRRDRAGPGR